MVELMIITAMIEKKRPSDHNDGIKVLVQETAQKVILFLTGTTVS